MRRDARWLMLEPLLPCAAPTPKDDRPPVPARAALTGIWFVLRTGLPSEMLPAKSRPFRRLARARARPPLGAVQSPSRAPQIDRAPRAMSIDRRRRPVRGAPTRA